MTNYADNTAIGDTWFDGETVPGDNTISTSRNTRISNRCQRYINNNVLGRTTDVDADVNGELEEAFLALYGGALDPSNRERADGTFGLPDTEIYRLRNVFGVESIHVHDPEDGTHDTVGRVEI